MNRIIFVLAFLLAIAGGARAQDAATTVAVCGTLPVNYVVGSVRTITQDVTGKICVNAVVTVDPAGLATAANQATQITAEQAIQAGVGAIGDAAWVSGNGSTIAILKNISAGVGSAIPAGTNVIGYTTADPCSQLTKTNVPISMQNTTTLKLVSLASAKQIYVCSLSLIASGATVFSVVEGTKSSTECDTAAAAVLGAAVAAHGLSLAANGGITYGNGGSTVARTATAAHDLCLFQSGSVDLSGNLTYVQP